MRLWIAGRPAPQGSKETGPAGQMRESSVYLRGWHYDTVNFDKDALELAIKFAGADRVLAGSDYPHQIGSIPSMLDAIGKLPVTDAERQGIYGGNAAKLLGIG